jgi:hypothetical protein
MRKYLHDKGVQRELIKAHYSQKQATKKIQHSNPCQVALSAKAA